MGTPEELHVVRGMCKHKHLGNLPKVNVLKAGQRVSQPSHSTSLITSQDTKRDNNSVSVCILRLLSSPTGGNGKETLSNLS